MKNFRSELIDWNTYLNTNDLVCFSPLSWDLACNRQQFLMNRFAKTYRVFFIEEPVFHAEEDIYTIKLSDDNAVWIVTPYLQKNTITDVDVTVRRKNLITKLFIDRRIGKFVAWYYTPMALAITNHLEPEMHVYDCIDELSSFTTASYDQIQFHEAEIFRRAKLVFTDNQNLYEVKKHAHKNIYTFENSELDKTVADMIDIFNENLLERSGKAVHRTILQSVA